MTDLEKLTTTVQKNCDLVDADHGQDYGLCIYLLKMRDFYRWHNRIPLHEDLINEDIHQWIAGIEEHWEEIEGEPFSRLAINGDYYNPFHARVINQKLETEGLVYSGGLSYGAVPLFFLAKLDKKENRSGFEIIISSDEYARGLFGPPALFHDNLIFIRKEAMRYFLWSRYDEWCFSKRDNDLGKAMSFYPFKDNPVKAIEDITENELETVIQHEIGEGLLEKEYDHFWRDMIVDFVHTKTEILLRAVRDLAADCMTTLPYLLSKKFDPSLHLYFAGFSDMRKELYPSLYQSYKSWQKSKDYVELKDLVSQGREYWFGIGKQIIDLYKSGGKSSQQDIDDLIEGAAI